MYIDGLLLETKYVKSDINQPNLRVVMISGRASEDILLRVQASDSKYRMFLITSR